MNNNEIGEQFSLLAALTEIHGENSFKAKSYSITAFNIDKLKENLFELPEQKLSAIKGIGPSSAKKITEIVQHGMIAQLAEIIQKTPEGVLEMIKIKGLGPKKINIIWKEMEIETIGELLYACKENRLKNVKGFGEKTQQTISDNIEFYINGKGTFLYAQTITAAEQTEELLKKIFGDKRVAVSGDFARQMEIITDLTFVVEEKIDVVLKAMSNIKEFSLASQDENKLTFTSAAGLKVIIHAEEKDFLQKLIETSSSPEFYEAVQRNYTCTGPCTDEASWFSTRKLAHIPAFLREDPDVLHLKDGFSSHLSPADIKGLIHCHSDWSDGKNTIEEMANAAIERGMEYMAISDHSKTASYAGGLSEEKIKAQHEYINELNQKLSPFVIFKSIESDILSDGSLDYSDKILSTFDLVIASVHSNLKMTEEKAMKRLISAIENPYTTIMGHLTGRLLLSRPGYPVDYRKIIDACAANHVVIELNANPNRLDMDWRQIKYALSKNVLISINPDAHSIKGIGDIRFGILSAQKGLLKKENNLSSFSLEQFKHFLSERKNLRQN